MLRFTAICFIVCINMFAYIIPVHAQDQSPPTLDDICKTLEAYRMRWQTFNATYTYSEPTRKYSLQDIFAYDNGRVYIDRTVDNQTGKGERHQHWIMCFDGEKSYSVSPPKGKRTTGVLITPGYDPMNVASHGQTCILGNWIYIFKPPLDEVIRSPKYRVNELKIGESIDQHPTIYLEQEQNKNGHSMLRYWLAADMDYLPLRMQLLADDGDGLHVFTEYRARQFEWFLDGYFPTDIVWGKWGETPSETIIGSHIKVKTIERTPGVFDDLFAKMVSPPANINDAVNDKLYRLVSDERFVNMSTIEDDKSAAKHLVSYLSGVDPKIAKLAQDAKTQHMQQLAAINPPITHKNTPWLRWTGLGLGSLAFLGAGGWWMLKHNRAV